MNRTIDVTTLPVSAGPQADGLVRGDLDHDCTVGLIPTPRATNHAPTLAVLPDGAMVAAWFGGSDEGNADIDILVSRFDPATQTWSQAEGVTADPGRSDQNPGLFLAAPDDLWLLYTSQASRQSGIPEGFNLQFTSVVRRIRSADGGATWSDPETLFDRPGTFCRQPVQRLQSGRLVHAQWLCFDDDTRNGSDEPLIQISDDGGATWTERRFPEAAGRVHPNVVELEPGRLVALFRSRWADWAYLSRSEDDGETWTVPVATAIANNNAGISALRLPSGRLGLVSNEEQSQAGPGEVLWPYERTRMTIAVSSDGGATWPERRIVEPGDGFTGPGNRRSNRRHEYPHAVLDGAGRIHMLYAYASRVAIKHVSFQEPWIDGVADQVHSDCKLWG